VAPGELPPELAFGRNLIGFTAEQEERLQVANAQAALLQLGYRVGQIDGKSGFKTKAAVKAFQKKQHLKVDGKINDILLEQLAMAIENLPPADPSQPDRAKGQ
jgi:peptidoglycan hydrolase-like protein with peptidoglycan-binding domain